MRFTTTVVASFLCTVPFVYGSANPSNAISARQDLPTLPPISSNCQKTCSSAQDATCTSLDCSCTEKNADGLEGCLTCVIKEDKSTADTCQKFMDSFTSSCTSLGKTLKSRKLSGSSGSSSSGNSASGSSGSSGGNGTSGGSTGGNGAVALKTTVSLGAFGAAAGFLALLL
ncbi:hypothetical protein V5O48_008315 [Marasmius crinis-equi]|uniref:Extracellular membrane protein CFEM domain-containing protein n=1 Tax=Marasmius crinis-equi TaxID=585013 RepID=A0ABR3FEC9_9AGAR